MGCWPKEAMLCSEGVSSPHGVQGLGDTTGGGGVRVEGLWLGAYQDLNLKIGQTATGRC